jgi:hypothetical protein
MTELTILKDQIIKEYPFHTSSSLDSLVSLDAHYETTLPPEKNTNIITDEKLNKLSTTLNMVDLLTQNSINYHLSKEAIDWIQLFIKNHPEDLNGISDELQKIIKDNVINLHEIPELIHIILFIYHEKAKNLRVSDPKVFIECIKYTIHIILTSGLIHCPYDINSVDRVIQTSLTLLETNLDVVILIEEEIKKCTHEGYIFKICNNVISYVYSLFNYKKN